MFERFTERARQVVVFAHDEAMALGHNYIGTEHVLIALARVEKGVAAQILSELGLNAEKIRSQVIQMLPGASSALRARLTWEYRIEILSGPNALTEELLAPFGRDGWELVAAVGDRLVFKRPS